MSTDLQRSIFGAPPSTATVGLAVKPAEVVNGTREGDAQVSQGIKRPREEESDGEAPMDEDESDAPMEVPRMKMKSVDLNLEFSGIRRFGPFSCVLRTGT